MCTCSVICICMAPCCSVISHQRWTDMGMSLRARCKGETIGNIVMAPWKMIHKHPDIRSVWLLPVASLSAGLNSFLFSGGSCLAATSCLECRHCLFVVTWNTCENSSAPSVTQGKHEGRALPLNEDCSTRVRVHGGVFILVTLCFALHLHVCLESSTWHQCHS